MPENEQEKLNAQIANNFQAELRALLTRYDADITAEERYDAEYGEDIRMTVGIARPGDYITLDLGRRITKDTLANHTE